MMNKKLEFLGLMFNKQTDDINFNFLSFDFSYLEKKSNKVHKIGDIKTVRYIEGTVFELFGIKK